MVVMTDFVSDVRIEPERKNKKKVLPIRRPVELPFKPDISEELMNSALDKAYSKYLSKK